MKKILVLLLLLILVSFTKQPSSIKLGSLFTDNMVVQQNDTLVIWGWSKEGTKVEVEANWGSKSNVIASKGGHWSVKIPTPKADNIPHTLKVSTKDTLINLQNILLGEVWLCSGQSNMEMPMKGFHYRKPYDSIQNSEYEIKNANYPEIRMFTVKKKIAFTPKDTCEGAWVVCTPETVPEFSATAYFFGKELNNKLNVPIGLIHSSWGGTPAQSWVPVDFVEKIDDFKNIRNQLVVSNDKNTPFNKWLASMSKVEWDSLILVEKMKWTDSKNKDILKPDYDDSNWETLSLQEISSSFVKDDFNGIAWLRQDVFIESEPPNDLTVDLGKTDDLYAFFINGTLVARKEYWGESNNCYKIPLNVLKGGINNFAIRFIDVWGSGGFETDAQRGIYSNSKKYISFNDKWKFKKTAVLIDQEFYNLNDKDKTILKPSPDRLSKTPHSPTVLYNSMIAPLIPYPIKGAIWYQGESNRGKAKQYQTLFPAVINSWRKYWNHGNFPFYYVQIAPFNYNEETPSLTAELREAQFLTLSKEKNVGMVVTMDIGSLTTIHPPNKQEVGRRLALWALAKDYGKKDLVYSGPLYKSVKFIRDKAIVSFDHLGSGLYSPDKNLTNFEIAGSDLVFYPANAFIREDKVVLYSHDVKNPKIVRFAWEDKAVPNFYNKEGLPASPFRSSEKTRIGPEELYPQDSITIKSHNEWTKNHYRERINEFKNNPLNFGDIVFIGNSITEGGKDWSVKFGVRNIKNRGIGGDITDGVLKRLDEITYFNPKAVFILIGINDLFNIYYQKEIPSVEYVGNNILKIAEIINIKSPSTKIYVQTILPTSKDFMRENIDIVNTIIKSNEKKNIYKVIDLNEVFTGQDGLLKAELTNDGTHLNKEGYQVWVNYVKPFMMKLYEK